MAAAAAAEAAVARSRRVRDRKFIIIYNHAFHFRIWTALNSTPKASVEAQPCHIRQARQWPLVDTSQTLDCKIVARTPRATRVGLRVCFTRAPCGRRCGPVDREASRLKTRTVWHRRANLGISAGVPQAHNEDRGAFSTLAGPLHLRRVPLSRGASDAAPRSHLHPRIGSAPRHRGVYNESVAMRPRGRFWVGSWFALALAEVRFREGALAMDPSANPGSRRRHNRGGH
jgi:hypothetical protein